MMSRLRDLDASQIWIGIRSMARSPAVHGWATRFEHSVRVWKRSIGSCRFILFRRTDHLLDLLRIRHTPMMLLLPIDVTAYAIDSPWAYGKRGESLLPCKVVRR